MLWARRLPPTGVYSLALTGQSVAGKNGRCCLWRSLVCPFQLAGGMPRPFASSARGLRIEHVFLLLCPRKLRSGSEILNRDSGWVTVKEKFC